MNQYPSDNAVIVGIDIGGTKTHVRAIPVRGGPARDLVVSSSEWRARDWNVDAARLLKLVASLVEEQPLAAIGVGAHGCDDAEECEAFQAALSANTQTPLVVVNDAELMPLALGFTGQIGVVAGTGSIAVCRPTPDSMLVVGGWGWIVGDEGSAAGLVREAVRAVSRHFDAGGGRGEPLVEVDVRRAAGSFNPPTGQLLVRNALRGSGGSSCDGNISGSGSRLASRCRGHSGRWAGACPNGGAS